MLFDIIIPGLLLHLSAIFSSWLTDQAGQWCFLCFLEWRWNPFVTTRSPSLEENRGGKRMWGNKRLPPWSQLATNLPLTALKSCDADRPLKSIHFKWNSHCSPRWIRLAGSNTGKLDVPVRGGQRKEHRFENDCCSAACDLWIPTLRLQDSPWTSGNLQHQLCASSLT